MLKQNAPSPNAQGLVRDGNLELAREAGSYSVFWYMDEILKGRLRQAGRLSRGRLNRWPRRFLLMNWMSARMMGGKPCEASGWRHGFDSRNGAPC
jgi:hypothetical protein